MPSRMTTKPPVERRSRRTIRAAQPSVRQREREGQQVARAPSSERRNSHSKRSSLAGLPSLPALEALTGSLITRRGFESSSSLVGGVTRGGGSDCEEVLVDAPPSGGEGLTGAHPMKMYFPLACCSASCRSKVRENGVSERGPLGMRDAGGRLFEWRLAGGVRAYTEHRLEEGDGMLGSELHR